VSQPLEVLGKRSRSVLALSTIADEDSSHRWPAKLISVRLNRACAQPHAFEFRSLAHFELAGTEFKASCANGNSSSRKRPIARSDEIENLQAKSAKCPVFNKLALSANVARGLESLSTCHR